MTSAMKEPLFASALSTEPNSSNALAATARDLASGLAGRKPDLVAVFVSHHHGEAIESLGPSVARHTGARNVIGCTGESIVGTSQEVERGPALALWAGVMPDTELRPFTAVATQEGDKFQFSSLPDVRDPSRAGILLLADPFTFPASEYLEAINDSLPGVPVVGGMASGGSGPGQNLLLTQDGIVESGAVGIVIEGGIEVRSIVSQGCRPVGKPYVITGCKDNFILKLGGKTALQALMEIIPELSPQDRTLLQNRPFIGLAIDAAKSNFERGDFLVRGMIGIEQKVGALAVNDTGIRVGQTVQFLVRDAASAGEDLVHLMRERAGAPPRDSTGAPPRDSTGTPPQDSTGAPARDSTGASLGGAAHASSARPAPNRPSTMGALLFSCNGRGSRMFSTPNHDIGCVQTAFERAVPAAGFFAMGEIGPVGGRNFLHGFTASVAVFRPRES
jgi:small ligand-binding sensory domain FIST